MRKTILFMGMLSLGILVLGSCRNQSARPVVAPTEDSSAVDEDDSTVYGVCGDGTAMHSLELITDAGDTLNYLITDDASAPVVKGGLFSGDRMAVIGHKEDGEYVATEVINLTALMGKWTSIDRDFEIMEGGTVKNYVKAETHPWVSWKICNGKLVLNRDTFTVDGLGADSLYIENSRGIFAFKRKK